MAGDSQQLSICDRERLQMDHGSANLPAVSTSLSRRAPSPLAARSARLALGVALSISALALVGSVTDASLLLAPFAATAALKHAQPDARATSPLVIVGSYLIGALAGLAAGQALGTGLDAAVVGTAAAAAVLALVRVEHAPAVAMAFVVVHTPTLQAVGVATLGAAVLVLTMQLVGPALHGVRPGLLGAATAD
jgi:CBS-domain-containing membrane protein